VRQLAGGVVVGLVRERGEDHRPVVDEVDAGALGVEVVEGLGDHLVDEVGDGACGLDAGRAGTDDDDVERALVDAGRVAVGGLEDLDQPVAQRLGVVDGVEGEGVLLGAGRVEEVRSRPGGEHQEVTTERLPVGGRHRPCRRVDRCHGRLLDVDALVAGEDAPQWPGDVGHGQLRRRHLVQERLELVVVVLVEQGHVDLVLGQLLGTADAGEATADDERRWAGGRDGIAHLVSSHTSSMTSPNRAV
jgi:hypothetical protein